MLVDMPRSILFVDGTNLDHRLSEGISDRDVDYVKLFAALSHGTQLLRTHFCTADYLQTQNPQRNAMKQRQLRTFNRLKQIGDVLIHKGRYRIHNSKCRNCRGPLVDHIEKGTDVRAATLLVHAACTKSADRFILVANDNDYLPAIELSRVVGAHVTLAYVVAKHSDHRDIESMRRAASNILTIDDAFMDGIWIEKPPEGRTEKRR